MKGVMVPRTLTCAMCGTDFVSSHSQSKYCGQECSQNAQRAAWPKYRKKYAAKQKLYQAAYYEKNRERVIARTSAYHKTERGKEATQVNDKRQREKFPERYAARQAVLMAVRKGILQKRDCEHCGAAPTHGHHPDYSKPLDVIWLCQKCHTAEHKAEKSHKHAPAYLARMKALAGK